MDTSASLESKRIKVISIAVIVVIVFLVALLATRPPVTSNTVNDPLVGKPAPLIRGTAVVYTPNPPSFKKTAVNLLALRGRFVVVNFFASWCTACQQDQSHLVRFAHQNDTLGGTQLIGVVFSDTLGNVRHFMSSTSVTWPVLLDQGGHLALDYGVRAPPETFVIDPNGIVVAHIDGPVTASMLEGIVAKAKAELEI